MKNFILFVMLTLSGEVLAENFIYETGTGRIIGHTSGEIVVVGTKAICGSSSVKPLKEDKVSAGSVAVWVEGAKNVSELGVVTVLDWDDIKNDADKSPKDIQALIDVIADITGTSTNDVKALFKDKKKKIKDK